jgi:hypothetical protein
MPSRDQAALCDLPLILEPLDMPLACIEFQLLLAREVDIIDHLGHGQRLVPAGFQDGPGDDIPLEFGQAGHDTGLVKSSQTDIGSVSF